MSSGISARAPCEADLRSAEGVLGAAQLTHHPPRVAEVGPGLRPEIEHPIRVVDLVQVPSDANRQIGEVDRLHRVVKDSFLTLTEEEAAEPPDVHLLSLLDNLQLLLERVFGQLGQELRRLPALEDGDRFVPVADLFLEPTDLLEALPAGATGIHEVGNHLDQDILMLQPVREPQGQYVQGQVGILHILLLRKEKSSSCFHRESHGRGRFSDRRTKGAGRTRPREESCCAPC